MDETGIMILSHLRSDARKSLVEVAKETGIPVSTVYDKVRKYEKSIIKKHSSIIDFQKIGYNIRVMMLVKLKKDEEFRKLANSHSSINSVFKLNEHSMYLIDCIFMYMGEMEDFLAHLEKCDVEEKDMHFISEEVVRENFLAKNNNTKMK